MDINKVTTAMIDYYQGQPKRIQHFLKVHAYAKLIGEQEGLDKEIYLNFAYDIQGYKIEPLIFSNQKENYQHYKIKTIEKVW